MKSKGLLYSETHRLPLNVYLLFFIYMLVVLIIANILPVLLFTYFVFLAFGLVGIWILFIKHTYRISINEKIIELSIQIPLNVSLLKLQITRIESIEEIIIDPFKHPGWTIIKSKSNYREYIFEKKSGIKLTMISGEVFIISGIAVNPIIKIIHSIKNSEHSNQC